MHALAKLRSYFFTPASIEDFLIADAGDFPRPLVLVAEGGLVVVVAPAGRRVPVVALVRSAILLCRSEGVRVAPASFFGAEAAPGELCRFEEEEELGLEPGGERGPEEELGLEPVGERGPSVVVGFDFDVATFGGRPIGSLVGFFSLEALSLVVVPSLSSLSLSPPSSIHSIHV